MFLFVFIGFCMRLNCANCVSKIFFYACKFFFFKVCIKLIKYDRKDIYNVAKDSKS